MHDVLSSNSSLIFVWHDNSGQSFPDSTALLNTQVSIEGFKIDIAANADIAEPIIIITSASIENHAQNIINIGTNANVQIIEYILSDDVDATNNVGTTINCGSGSKLKHCLLLQSKEATNINQQSITNIYQDTDSNVITNIFSFGGRTSKIELAIALQGQNANCEAACLAYTHNAEIQNVLLKIDHLVPHCTSKALSRAVLKDNSSTDFVGRVVVHPNASKSFADLQIKNLLCSPKAQANNRPELEIYNDDVHCSHGSSTGQINEEALFYMRSRGLTEAEATAMMIEGFVQPTIDSCTIPEIADFVKNIIKVR